jgi:hypothetical protein
MMEVGVINPAHQQKLFTKTMLEDQKCKELAKNCPQVQLRNSETIVTPTTPIPEIMSINSLFPFGGTVRKSGEGQVHFVPFDIFIEDSNVVLRRAYRSIAVIGETKRLETVFKIACEFDKDFFCAPTRPQSAECVKPIHEVFRHLCDDVFGTFSPFDRVWSNDKISTHFCEVMASVCFVVGKAGYVEQHVGGLDDVCAPLNCLSASIRLCLLMRRFGYNAWVMLNQIHAFAAVDGLEARNKVTYVECAVNQPALFVYVRDKLLKKLTSTPQSTGRKKKRKHVVGCFCKQPTPPDFVMESARGPREVEYWECAGCGRDFHNVCVDMRDKDADAKLCFICKPQEDGCFCGGLIHFKGYSHFSGEWISCDECGRWLHWECTSWKSGSYK